MRRTLDLSDRDRLKERGVYRASDVSELSQRPAGSDSPGREDPVLSPEWLDDTALEERFSQDPDLTAALPRGRVVRLDADPRVVVLEDVPEPSMHTGEVTHSDERHWIIDSRDAPAAVSLPDGDHEVIFWGERGEIRLYILRRG